MSESGANFGSTMQPTSDLKKPFKTAEELKSILSAPDVSSTDKAIVELL